MGNPYFKTTKGYNAEVVVATTSSYITGANFATFASSVPDGMMAVVKADDNTIAPGNANLPVGTKVFIAQKRDGAVHKTSIFEVGKENGKLSVYKAPVKQVVTATVDPAAKFLEIAIIETTVGNRAVDHAWNFEQPVTGTVADALTALAAKIGDKNRPENYAFDVVATATATATVLTVTAINGDRTFDLSIRQGFLSRSVTNFGDPGVGTPAQIREIEKEGHIYDGVTTNYIDGTINPSEMGEAKSFVDNSLTYDTLLLSPTLTEKSPLPFHEHKHFLNIFVAIPTSSGARTAILTILGYIDDEG